MTIKNLLKAILVYVSLCLPSKVTADHHSPANPTKSAMKSFAQPYSTSGIASYYNLRGRKTASGQRYSPNKLTAASKTLPLGTEVLVTNLDTGANVKVLINDRGPYVKGRILDLSVRSAKLLGFKHEGLAKVKIVVLKWPPQALSG